MHYASLYAYVLPFKQTHTYVNCFFHTLTVHKFVIHPVICPQIIVCICCCQIRLAYCIDWHSFIYAANCNTTIKHHLSSTGGQICMFRIYSLFLFLFTKHLCARARGLRGHSQSHTSRICANAHV